MKKLICSGMIACLVGAALPVHASEMTAAASEPAAREGLRASVQRVAQTAPLVTAATPAAAVQAAARQSLSPALTNLPRPDRGPDRSRKQMGGGGGSKTGMIVGLVSAAAGIAGTVYMVKMMKDSNNSANDQ